MGNDKGLPLGWSEVGFKESCTNISLTGIKVKEKEYKRYGKFPTVDQGKELIGGYFDDENMVINEEPPYIVFGDHTKVKKFITFKFIAGGDGLKVLKANKIFDPKLLYYFIQAIKLPDKGYARHYQYLEKEIVPLPPINEQHRIVERLEALFSELDSGVKVLKTAQEQLKVYRQAVLYAAFSGKLTEEWRGIQKELQTGENLLKQIHIEREKNTSRAGKKLKVIAINEEELKELSDIPKEWRWTKLANISIVGTGATPLKSKTTYYKNGNIPWVTSSALNCEYVTKATDYVTEMALNETNLKLFPKHTILMAMYGEGKTRGKCSELLIEATTNQAIAAIVLNGIAFKIRPFLKYFLLKNYNEIRRKASGGVQPNINLGIVENLIIPIACIAEQQQIVQEIDARFSICDQLEKTIEQSLAKAEVLRQSILQRAFAGKLVSQDPNDEPAYKLLDRIRLARENNKVKKEAVKGRTKK